MHQPVDDDYEITRDPTHLKDCSCLRCYCMNLIDSADEADEHERQLAKKVEDGTPTLQDLKQMLDLGWCE